MATSPHQFLTEKLAYYYLTFFQCSDRVRHYGSSCGDAESRLVYEEAIKQWRGDATNPLRQPPPGPEDQLKSDAFFAACDSMCSLEPQNLHDAYTIGLACSVGTRFIHDHQLTNMPNKDEIIATAQDLAHDRHKRQNSDSIESLNDAFANLPLASHPQPAISATLLVKHRHQDLIDTTIRYRNRESGEVMECIVRDCGTSVRGGDWVEVAYNDLDRVLRISPEEMDDILFDEM